MSVRIKTTAVRGNRTVYFEPVFETLKDVDKYTRRFGNGQELIEKCIENGDLANGNYYIMDIALEYVYTVEGEEKSKDLRPIYSENRELELYGDVLDFLRDVKEVAKTYKGDAPGIRSYLQSKYGLDRPEFFNSGKIKIYIKNLYFWSERKQDEVLAIFNSFSRECLDEQGNMLDTIDFDPEEYNDFETTSLKFYATLFQVLLDTAGSYKNIREFYQRCSSIDKIKEAYDVYLHDRVYAPTIDPFDGLERPYELDEPGFFDDDDDIEPGGKTM